MQTYDISLDMRKAPGRIERTVTVRRGDNDTQQISAAITAGGQPYTPKGTARLDILHADGTWARCSASLSGSTVSCTLPSEALNGAGRCRAAHFVFTDGAKVESTEGFALVIEANVATEGTPGAQGYEDELEAMKAAWREFSAQAGRDEAERREAEESRKQEEGKRAAAETERKKAEDARKAEESKRAEAETARAQAEAARASKESERATAETARRQAETARAEAETARASAETSRASEESKRAEAERARAAAETARAQAETARAQAQAKNDADQALNNEQMKKLSPVILQEGQYDRATLKPTIEGEPNRMYFVPMVAPAAIELFGLTKTEVQAGNSYVEWMWVGGRWEQMGQSEMRSKPISTDQIDAVFSGGHPTGDDVLSLTGLDYVKTKADSAYAASTFRGELSGGDLNRVTAPGCYKVNDGGRIRNFPPNAYKWGVLEVSSATADGGFTTQTYTAHQGSDNAGQFFRCCYDGSWRPWQRQEFSGHRHDAGHITSGTLHADRIPSLPVAKVSGLQGALDSKADASHTHEIANVNGLQSALDGKAAYSHTHGIDGIDGLRDEVARLEALIDGVRDGALDFAQVDVEITNLYFNGNIVYEFDGINRFNKGRCVVNCTAYITPPAHSSIVPGTPVATVAVRGHFNTCGGGNHVGSLFRIDRTAIGEDYVKAFITTNSHYSPGDSYEPWAFTLDLS